MQRATLAGTSSNPHFVLEFDRDAVLPAGHPKAGESLLDWVRRAPGRVWDSPSKTWHLTATGKKKPTEVLERAGFDIVYPDDVDTFDADELWAPLAKQAPGRPGIALVRHRFAGFNAVVAALPSASWDKAKRRFEVPIADLVDKDGDPVAPIEIADDATHHAAVEASVRTIAHSDKSVNSAAAAAALSTGEGDQIPDISKLVEAVGDVPEWFGEGLLTLRPYQRLAALAANAGRNYIADDPGVGKSLSALAAAAVRGDTRVLIVSPPVAVTHWGVESARSGVTVSQPIDCEPTSLPEHVALVRTGRKEPELPDVGVVVVPDSLLANRKELMARLIAWQPGTLIVDEAHRFRTWDSARAQAIRSLSLSMPADTLRLPLTGTPMFSCPAELAAQLAISGHLGPVFGGYEAFIEETCRRDNYNKLRPQKRKLPSLRRTLDTKVWVRRKKSDVLPDLPGKSRTATWVDIDLTLFRKAHGEVIETVCEWIDEHLEETGDYPNQAQIEDYAMGRVGLISPLRKAAGLSKVPEAVEMIESWVAANVTDGVVDEPLLVWAHHHEVVDALVEAAASKVGASLVDVIDGSKSSAQRGQSVTDFQAGNTAVLICSVTAAGVGVTLTRGSTQIFVETSWDVPEVTQAEDRQNRFGQENHVTISYLLAAGTLDGRIFKILADKSEVLAETISGSDVVSIEGLDIDGLQSSVADLAIEVVHEAIKVHKRTTKNRLAAAA